MSKLTIYKKLNIIYTSYIIHYTRTLRFSKSIKIFLDGLNFINVDII